MRTVSPEKKSAPLPWLKAALAAALCLALLAAPQPARAKFFTPQILEDFLNSGEPDKYNQAYGYILGVYDSFEGVIFTHRHDIGEQELVDQVDKYIRKHAGEHYYSAQLMVLRALEELVRMKDAREKEK